MHLLRCVHAAHRLIMAFCHIKELTTERRGGASHHARRDRVRFCVFSRLCKEEFVHDLENLMKVMEDSRGRANSRASSFFHPHRVRPRNQQAGPQSHGFTAALPRQGCNGSSRETKCRRQECNREAFRPSALPQRVQQSVVCTRVHCHWHCSLRFIA